MNVYILFIDTPFLLDLGEIYAQQVPGKCLTDAKRTKSILISCTRVSILHALKRFH